MAIERFRTERRETSSGEGVEQPPQRGRLTPARIPWIVTFLVLVALPVVFSWEFSLWREVPVSDPYGGTPALVAFNATGTSAEVEFHFDVGHYDTQNIYQHHSCDGLLWNLNPDGTVNANVSETNDCSQGLEFPETAGLCCASEDGWGQDGVVYYAVTGIGFTLQEALVQATPTPVWTAVPVGGDFTHISATYGRWSGGSVVTAYDLTNSRVNVYTRPDPGPWTLVTDVSCDSPYTNYHWTAASDPTSTKLWVGCNTGGPVQLYQVDLGTGTHDWSVQIDNVPSSSDFYYQQCDYCGVTRLPDGSNGKAVACWSPSPNGTEMIVLAPVEGTLPTTVQHTSFPDAAPDRQVWECDGAMAYYHGTDPAGFGALTRVINCGDLSGPCIYQDHVDPSRGVTFAGGPPPYVWVPDATPTPILPTPHPLGKAATAERTASKRVATPSVRSIRYDRLPIVEGYNPPGQNSDVVRFGALTVPSFFDYFESGNLRMWTTAVGASKDTPSP